MAIEQLLAAIRQDAKLCPQASLEHSWVISNPNESTILMATNTVQSLLSEARKEEKQARRDKWHQWTAEQEQRGSGNVYRWIRDGPRVAPTPTAAQGTDGKWRHGRTQAVAASDAAWWAIWGKPQASKPLSDNWLQHLRELPPSQSIGH